MFLHQEALPNISKSRLEQMSQDIMNFLQGFISELTLFNVTQARVLVKVIKQLYDKFVLLIFRRVSIFNLNLCILINF